MVRGDTGEWLKEAHALERRVPGIDEIGSIAGRALDAAGRWREAWERYRPGIEHGTVGVGNRWGWRGRWPEQAGGRKPGGN
jgi:hypothetical protein